MITLRKFFIVLLALTALVVVAYSVYEMTPEGRARRMASRMMRLIDDWGEDPERHARDEFYRKTIDEIAEDLFEVACLCGMFIDDEPGSWRAFHDPANPQMAHGEDCLFKELIFGVRRHLHETSLPIAEEMKGRKEVKPRRALEDSHR